MASLIDVMELGPGALPEDVPDTFLQTKKLFPRSDNYVYKQGDIIRFDFPNIGYLKPDSCFLSFQTRVIFPQGDNSYYVGGTNTLRFVYDVGGVPANVTITIPVGFYTGTTLAAAIQALVLAATPTAIPNFVCTFNTTTKIFSMSQSVDDSKTTKLLNADQLASSMILYLGGEMTTRNLFSTPVTFAASIFAVTANDRFYPNSACMITKARLLYDEHVIEEVQDMDILQRWLSEATPLSGYYGQEGVTMQNSGDFNERVACASGLRTNYKRFNVPLTVGWLSQKVPIALKYMAAFKLSLELTFSQDIRVFTSFQAQFQRPTIEYFHAELLYDEVELPEAWDRAFLNQLKSGGIQYKFTGWTRDSFNPRSAQEVINLKYPQISAGILAIAGVITDTPQWISDYYDTFSYGSPSIKRDLNLNATTNTGQYLSTSADAASYLKSYQWRVDEKFYPVQPIRVQESQYTTAYQGSEGADALQYLLKAVGRNRSKAHYEHSHLTVYRWASPYQQIATPPAWLLGTASLLDTGCNSDLSETPGSVTTNASPCFLMAGDFQRSVDGERVTGVNFDKARVVQLQLNWNANPASGMQVVVFMGYLKAMVLKEHCAVTVHT